MDKKLKFFNKTTTIITIVCTLITSVLGVFLLRMESIDNSVIIKAENSHEIEQNMQNSEFSVYDPEIYGLINLNTASKQELMLLEGIGDKKAEAIIKYRESKPFKSIGEIKKINGIGNGIFNKIKNMICVE